MSLSPFVSFQSRFVTYLLKVPRNKEIYAIVKRPTITKTIRLHGLCWFGHVLRMEENRIPKRVLHMNLESTQNASSFV
jgi:hypothetical protein